MLAAGRRHPSGVWAIEGCKGSEHRGRLVHDGETAGPERHSGTTLQTSVTDLTPDTGSLDKPLPGPATRQPEPVPAVS